MLSHWIRWFVKSLKWKKNSILCIYFWFRYGQRLILLSPIWWLNATTRRRTEQIPNYKIDQLFPIVGQIKSNNDIVNMSNHTDPNLTEKRLKTVHVFRNALKKCWTTNGRIKFIITALGIFGSFFCVGILQEMVMRGCYGDDTSKNCKHGERFKYAMTLVLVKSFCGLVFVQGNSELFILFCIFFTILQETWFAISV